MYLQPGFLGSEEQIDHCLAFIHTYPNALAVVDPVMGDHGKAYRTYTGAMCERMRELVREADVITPNLTEACLLLNLPYIDRRSRWRMPDSCSHSLVTWDHSTRSSPGFSWMQERFPIWDTTKRAIPSGL